MLGGDERRRRKMSDLEALSAQVIDIEAASG
jgi:hypothetical protein